LHLLGRKSEVTTFSYIFDRYSSFLHRLITYMLYRCGAFALDFSDLPTAVSKHDIDPANVLCRHGANTIDNLKSLFAEPERVVLRLKQMQEKQEQPPERFWSPGTFPHYSNR
jgi:hypothetical protein